MATYKNYWDEIYNSGKSTLDASKTALDKQAEKDKESINATADKSIADIENAYNTKINEANEASEIAHQKNEMQKLLNERHLERKAAEIGLTDSGHNLTQLTANQLSYGNQKADIDNNRQKTVDTLAAAMASKVADVNINRNSSINAVDTQLGIDKANLEASYETSVADRAQKLYEKDVENANKYPYYSLDAYGNARYYSADDRKTEWNNVQKALESATDKNAAASLIYNFDTTFGLTESEEAILRGIAGISDAELTQYYNSAYNYSLNRNPNKTVTDVSIYGAGNNKSNYIYSPEYIQPGEWDTSVAGRQNYTIKVTKAGKDGKAKVTITAPNGDIVADNQQISSLDFDRFTQKQIEDFVKGKDKDWSGTKTINLG